MRYLVLLFTVFLFSCAPGKPTDDQPETATASAPDEILFLTFKIEKDSLAQQNKLTLMHKTKGVGKLKAQPEHAGTPNFLTVEVFQRGQLVKTFTLAHPLYKHVEYVNEHNHFAVKDAVVDQEEFFFRLQTKGNGYSVRISETLKSEKPTELLTLTL